MRISGTGELHYQTSRLDSPPRLVLDFADTRLSVAQDKSRPASLLRCMDVRLGQPTPGQSRIVIDLAKSVTFSAQADGSNVTISFTTLRLPLPQKRPPSPRRCARRKARAA